MTMLRRAAAIALSLPMLLGVAIAPAQAETVCTVAPNGAPFCYDNGAGGGTGTGGSSTGNGGSGTYGNVPPPPPSPVAPAPLPAPAPAPVQVPAPAPAPIIKVTPPASNVVPAAPQVVAPAPAKVAPATVHAETQVKQEVVTPVKEAVPATAPEGAEAEATSPESSVAPTKLQVGTPKPYVPAPEPTVDPVAEAASAKKALEASQAADFANNVRASYAAAGVLVGAFVVFALFKMIQAIRHNRKL